MQDGKFFEGAVLGRCFLNWDGYMAFKKAVKAIKRKQPGSDPTDPEKRVANDLHSLVCEELGVNDYSQVSFFTAVDSPLDFFHGVDGWFEFLGRMVTIDVTLNPKKNQAKADVIILGNDDGIPMLTLKNSAKKIAAKFERRCSFVVQN